MLRHQAEDCLIGIELDLLEQRERKAAEQDEERGENERDRTLAPARKRGHQCGSMRQTAYPNTELRAFLQRARRSVWGREAGVAAAVSIAIAATLAIVWTRRPIVLADAAMCSGIVDLAAVVALRALPETPVGNLLAWSNGIIVVVALASLSMAMRGRPESLAAIVALFAFFATQSFDRTLAAAAGLSLVACVSLAWHALFSDSLDSRASARRAAALAAIIALISPALLLPCVALVASAIWMGDGGSARRRLLVVFAATLGMAAATTAVVSSATRQWGMATLASCVLPSSGAAGLLRFRKPIDVCSRPDRCRSGSPCLGAFAYLERRRQWRTWWAVALAAAPIIDGFADPGMLAPVWAGVWCLSAIGLSELFRGSHGRLKTVVSWAS